MEKINVNNKLEPKSQHGQVLRRNGNVVLLGKRIV